jgi:hypothetical protein
MLGHYILGEFPIGGLQESYRILVLNWSGLLSYWGLDEITNNKAYDFKGSNDGTYNGGYTLEQSSPILSGYPKGNSVLLNGTNGYIDCGAASNLNLNRTLSIEAWIKPSNNSTSPKAIFSKPNGGIYLRINQNHLNFLKSQISDIITGTFTFSSGNWYHVVLTVDASGNINLYVNGVLDISGSTSLTFSSSNHGFIGCDGIGSELFPGNIDELSIYNSILTAEDVRRHYLVALDNNSVQEPSGALRLTQLTRRTLILPTNANLRLTQLARRVLRHNSPEPSSGKLISSGGGLINRGGGLIEPSGGIIG